MKTSLMVAITMVAALVLAGCGPSASQVATAIAQTQAAMVTPTPLPTSTPVPTATPTPVPSVPGVDTPISVGNVTLQITDVKIVNGEVDVGQAHLTPKPGWSVLIVTFDYTGDIADLFSKGYQGENKLYLEDETGTRKNWVTIYFEESTHMIQVAFFVMSDSKEQVLWNQVGTPWSIDLTPLIKKSASSL